jgi:hypothetical protein
VGNKKERFFEQTTSLYGQSTLFEGIVSQIYSLFEDIYYRVYSSFYRKEKRLTEKVLTEIVVQPNLFYQKVHLTESILARKRSINQKVI